jgi:protein TonB
MGCRWTVHAGRLLLAALLGTQGLGTQGLGAQSSPIVVPPDVQQKRLVLQVRPVYPQLAWKAGIQGKVRFAALIDETGAVDQLKLISGNRLLVGAAMDAVKQWRYLPALRNGLAVPVSTTIEIPFTIRLQKPESHARTIRVFCPRATLVASDATL